MVITGDEGRRASFAPKGVFAQGFDEFTFARRRHWEWFEAYGLEFFRSKVDPDAVDLKRYQDLFVYAFVKDHIPQGSRLLEVGGGHSRLLQCFSSQYECWNIDKFEGLGSGPLAEPETAGYQIIKDYMGNFSDALPSDYFDLVFSVSALEHVPQDDSRWFDSIVRDIDRVLKPGGYSLHLFDIVFKTGKLRVFNKFIYHVFTSVATVNHFVHPNTAYSSLDLYVLSRVAYNKIWKKITKVSYEDFGEPTSMNALWMKPMLKE